MRVVLASRNPAKLRAVERAFRQVFPGVDMEFLPLEVPSGVAAQPNTDAETRRGALNRVANARAACPDAEFWVGLEGGLEWIDGQALASAWMAVGDASGAVSAARTPTLPLPPPVRDLLLQGMELGEANDRVFSTRNSKQAGGAFSLLTGGLLTREGVYAEALLLALTPFVNPLWRRGAAD